MGFWRFMLLGACGKTGMVMLLLNAARGLSSYPESKEDKGGLIIPSTPKEL